MLTLHLCRYIYLGIKPLGSAQLVKEGGLSVLGLVNSKFKVQSSNLDKMLNLCGNNFRKV